MIALGIFIFVVFLFSYLRKRSTREQREAQEQFWQRENEANHTRRQDISGLPYINIPLEQFPVGIFEDDALKEDEKKLLALSEKKILNLGGITNTELKLLYGAANLPALSEYDQNFTLLCRTLVTYAGTLLSLGRETEAQTVLEFGISCGSDASRNYRMLAELYRKQGMTKSLDRLRDAAEQLNSPMKASILRHLESTAADAGTPV